MLEGLSDDFDLWVIKNSHGFMWCKENCSILYCYMWGQFILILS